MTIPDLAALARDAAHEELPALIGQLETAKAVAWARLTTPNTNGNGHEPETWITPEQASTIAGVEKERIYSWAKGKKWASRPSRRCLRIAEESFRRWLATRT